MASNTQIFIKRSLANTTPGNLHIGELAYSYASNTLFIGANTATGPGYYKIGGEYYTNIIDSATSANTPDTLVIRDGNGDFAAGNVTAAYFIGDGSALTGLVTNLTVDGDSGGPNTINLLTDTLTIAGGEGLTSNVDGNTITLDVDDTVVRSNTEGASQHINTDVQISGNLTVQGTTTYVESQINQTNDSLIELAANNTIGDVLDIGFYGKHEGADGTVVTGLVRNAGTSDFYLFDNIALGDQENLTSNIITQSALSANGASLYAKQFFAADMGQDGGYAFNTASNTGLFSDVNDSDIYLTINGDKVLNANNELNNYSLGQFAGEIDQSEGAIAVGYYAGNESQNYNAIAIGKLAGNYQQSGNSVSIGAHAGNYQQDISAVAIGAGAGETSQSFSGVAIGRWAGQDSQGWDSVAVGRRAGRVSQGDYSVAMGWAAGVDYQGYGAVAIGELSGSGNQGGYAVAIGSEAGNTSQGWGATAIGRSAGNSNQGTVATAIGSDAGRYDQGRNSVAIGRRTGETTQGEYSVALGNRAGQYQQGNNAIAIGSLAGQENQHENSIVLNASGDELNGSQDAGLYIDPIRANNATGGNVTAYNTSTKELVSTDVTINNSGITLANGTVISDGESGLFVDSLNVAVTANVAYYNAVTHEITYGAAASGNAISNGAHTWTVSADTGAIYSDLGTALACSANSVLLGNNIDYTNDNYGRVAIGIDAAASGQNSGSVAIGEGAGNSNQNYDSVAVGHNAGNTNQNYFATAVGYNAGQGYQGTNSVAIGHAAAQNYQDGSSVAVGFAAGNDHQGYQAVAVGRRAGRTYQGDYSTAIGTYAGQDTQNQYAVAVGYQAGQTHQGHGAIAIGDTAGNNYQSTDTIAIGTYAGENSANTNGWAPIAIGRYAGQEYAGSQSVSIGNRAGANNIGYHAVALGHYAGNEGLGDYGIAIGDNAGYTAGEGTIIMGSDAGYQANNYSIAIGHEAGYYASTSGLGDYQIALGYRAAYDHGFNNSIVLNASGSDLSASASGLYVNPIRYTETQDNTYDGLVFYNSDTKEVRYSYALDGGSF